MEHVVLWLKFLVAAGTVVWVGMKLTHNAELLARAMGWGQAFAGFVVLGWATSLPEVTISLSAVESVGSAALASGNIAGSILFNLAILANLDLFASASARAKDHAGIGLTSLGSFNVVMLVGTVALGWAVTRGADLAWPPSRSLGAFLLVGYLAAAWWSWRQGRGEPAGDVDDVSTARRFYALRCLGCGAVILAAGIWLSSLGDEVARAHQLDEGFVGTLFLGSVSSLPELVTGVAAVRLGLLTMAAGSILGSNIFNLGVLGLCDLVYQRAEHDGVPLLAAADDPRLVWNFGASLVMTGVIMFVLRLRRREVGGRPVGICYAVTMSLYLAAIALS